MQAVQTDKRVWVPFTFTRIFWTFGRNDRAVIPVVCKPIPPLLFAKPCRIIRLPDKLPFLQISQTLAMIALLAFET
jgi:hypothetical protein